MHNVIDLNKAKAYVDSITRKPELVVDDGNLPATAEALRDLIAASGKYYDRDGPVRVVSSTTDGSPTVMRLTKHNVVMETHKLCRPVKLTPDGPKNVTLPDRLAEMYLDMYGEWKLPPLDGISTAPLLSADGSIQWADGYDDKSKLWCSNIPKLAPPTRPSRAEAEAALLLLREAFKTFPFSDAVRRPDDAPAVEVVDIGSAAGTGRERLPPRAAHRRLSPKPVARAGVPVYRAGRVGGRKRQGPAGPRDLRHRLWNPSSCIHDRRRP